MSAPEGGVDESALRWKLQRVPSHIVDKALALYVVLTERGTPAWVRALAVAALAYLMNPLDACPDALPGIGLIDDLAVLALALDRLARHVTPAVEARVERLRPQWLAVGADSNELDPATINNTHRQENCTNTRKKKITADADAAPAIESFSLP